MWTSSTATSTIAKANPIQQSISISFRRSAAACSKMSDLKAVEVTPCCMKSHSKSKKTGEEYSSRGQILIMPLAVPEAIEKLNQEVSLKIRELSMLTQATLSGPWLSLTGRIERGDLKCNRTNSNRIRPYILRSWRWVVTLSSNRRSKALESNRQLITRRPPLEKGAVRFLSSRLSTGNYSHVNAPTTPRRKTTKHLPWLRIERELCIPARWKK